MCSQGFGALRTCYETFIVFELFKGVVERFKEQVSPGRLKDIVWDRSVVEDIDKKYGDLSRFVEGHTHSDAYAGKKPTPALLLGEIEFFEGLKKRLKPPK